MGTIDRPSDEAAAGRLHDLPTPNLHFSARECARPFFRDRRTGVRRSTMLRGRRRQRRRLGGHLSRPAHHADAGGTAFGRGHEPRRAAIGDGHVARRHPARTLGGGSAVARLAARDLSEHARAEGHARRRLAVRHSSSSATDRDGDRPQARANGRQSGVEYLGHGRRRAISLRLHAGPVDATIAASASRSASSHLLVSRHRLVHLLDQDRGGHRARNGLHSPRPRTDHRCLGDL